MLRISLASQRCAHARATCDASAMLKHAPHIVTHMRARACVHVVSHFPLIISPGRLTRLCAAAVFTVRSRRAPGHIQDSRETLRKMRARYRLVIFPSMCAQSVCAAYTRSEYLYLCIHNMHMCLQSVEAMWPETFCGTLLILGICTSCVSAVSRSRDTNTQMRTQTHRRTENKPRHRRVRTDLRTAYCKELEPEPPQFVLAGARHTPNKTDTRH